MGTPLSTVFKKFLGQIDDKEWLLVEDDIIEDLMLDYLESATVDFTQCRKDLSFIPPDKGEVKYEMDGLTTEIPFVPKDSNRELTLTIINTSDNVEYEHFLDFNFKDDVITFTTPPVGEIVVKWKLEGEFIENLATIEIRILAHAMVLHYLKPKIMTQDSLKQFVSDKDFTKLSGANMLLRLMGLEKSQSKQLSVLQGQYAFQEFEGWN